MTSFHALLMQEQLPIGTYLGEFATPGIGEILAAVGCEFVFVDMEHSGFSFQTSAQILRNLHGAGLATMLRVPSKAAHHLQRAADIGAQGVIAPMVGTAQEARDCIAALKYAPDGQRGVAIGIAHDDFRKRSVPDAMRHANQKTGFVALIETAEGVTNCEEIMSLPGVDAIWIGHLDLSVSLGIPGDFNNPLFLDAVTRIMAAAADAETPVGRLVGSAEEAARCHREGCRLMCYLGDIWLLQKALGEGIATIRSQLGNNS
ncbi:HpcH/HpaI aldolase family protein [Roseobacter litoralis]|uniref:5-keto-4-deoxy-D-glucarate aldolase n=1 Tax=Roseobacter litoralis (strain ATCC 49566 / DSM 6996 / JCM 21268 / NBRC 15278 / OCh 149) TaxID=391595 RepID=F7ZCD8_ROSLO|nr:aldolase/citrate lyase family protein [Roseobacter litoralis]AEI95711.1 putative 5-keto-4-deoxy-D-glucarate aldolase [Roseobacter litoralis Och 149]